jgi:hypothetical protein
MNFSRHGHYKVINDVISKISFYCYFFAETFDCVCRYDILWSFGNRFLVKHTEVDTTLNNPSREVTAFVYYSLTEAIEAIIRDLRNAEIQYHVYKKLRFSSTLDDAYRPLVEELEQAIRFRNIKSFSMFGHLCKYKPQTEAKNFLKSMGSLCSLLSARIFTSWTIF